MTYILIVVFSMITVFSVRYFINHNRILGSLTCAISFFGIYLALYPEASTQIANIFGVGRGADLLLYFLFFTSLLGLFTAYLKINQTHQLVTRLTRSIAITNAKEPVTPSNIPSASLN